MLDRTYRVSELAALMEGQLILGGEDHLVSGVADIAHATAKQATFLENLKYRRHLAESQAALICIKPEEERVEGKNYLLTPSPSKVFQKIAELFVDKTIPLPTHTGIHPTAWIDPSATLDAGVIVGAFVFIDRNVRIGSHTRIDSHVVIGAGSSLGNNCLIHPHVTIRENCHLANRVIIQPGAVIGSCGFGYISSPQGVHTKIPHYGSVVLEDDVEIGANSTIDRGRFNETRIGTGTKIDNQVQIGHNVRIGSSNLIVSQVGIAGSSQTGKGVILGGQVGIVGHVQLTDGVIVTAQSGVSKDLLQPGIYSGSPTMGRYESNRIEALTRKLPEFAQRLKQLEQAAIGSAEIC